MRRALMVGLLACSILIGPGAVKAEDDVDTESSPPTCSEIGHTAADLQDQLWSFSRAVAHVERRSQVQWLAMNAVRSIDYIVDEAYRVRNIYPRNEYRCAAHIQRFRNYTERQFCPDLLALRQAFRDNTHLAQNPYVFDAWRDVVYSWEVYRDTVGVVGCGEADR